MQKKTRQAINLRSLELVTITTQVKQKLQPN